LLSRLSVRGIALSACHSMKPLRIERGDVLREEFHASTRGVVQSSARATITLIEEGERKRRVESQ
jgi:hypothetical protein